MEEKAVKPFLKWAGGKSQLLNEIKQRYPLSNNHITRYVEPFVGGGAVLFDILNNFNIIKDIYINDINEELINAYRVIKENVNELIDILKLYQSEYTPLNTEKRKFYYTEKRKRFNELKIKKNKKENIEKAALMIFLNKTCFNGLYRVNKSGYFNVPMGSYKNPLICDENNLRAVSRKLQKVTIMCGDYKKLINLIDENTFVYFDPPYKPLTNTANFTSYTENSFDDKKQIELSNFINEIHKKGAKILLSNSDPKNSNPKDNFFDILYSDYKIKRVDATRMINCSGKSRGKIKELLISNF